MDLYTKDAETAQSLVANKLLSKWEGGQSDNRKAGEYGGESIHTQDMLWPSMLSQDIQSQLLTMGMKKYRMYHLASNMELISIPQQ